MKDPVITTCAGCGDVISRDVPNELNTFWRSARPGVGTICPSNISKLHSPRRDEIVAVAPRRASWDATWMMVADAVALRSGCHRRQIGAVVVSAENVLLATGYNGQAAGYDESCDTCPRFLSGDAGTQYTGCISIHAESNALIMSDRLARNGGTIYISSAACWDCAKVVANSGLTRVVHRVEDRDDYREPWRGEEYMTRSGLTVIRWI